MRTATIVNKINTLPKRQRLMIAEKVLRSLRCESEVSPLNNPDNPSPSGDPWFDDPRNIAEVEEGLRDIKEGRVHRLDEDEELQAIFARCRQ